MFGFVSRDSKIVEGINEKDASYVLKLIKKYKKHLFSSIQSGDKDYIFSNIILSIITKIETSENVKLDELVKAYANEVEQNKFDIKGFEIYNDRDLLKYIVKHWENSEVRKNEYCEVFNSLLENEIPEAGNEPCYSMLIVKGDRIDIKQFANDFSIYYYGDDDCYSSDFEHIDHIEVKRNANNQITGAFIVFTNDFSVMVWANTVTDSENIERLQDLVQKHGVIKESKEEFKTVS
ncbi:MAG: hypothetical protein ACRCWM_04960 [Sarcina sp.]